VLPWSVLSHPERSVATRGIFVVPIEPSVGTLQMLRLTAQDDKRTSPTGHCTGHSQLPDCLADD